MGGKLRFFRIGNLPDAQQKGIVARRVHLVISITSEHQKIVKNRIIKGMTHLKIACLGVFHVTLDGETIREFRTDKVRALLAYLAVENERPQRREALAGLLWPDQPQENAMHSLRQALSTLKRALPDEQDGAPYLFIEREAVQFNPRSACWLDVQEFKEKIEAALQHYQPGAAHSRLNIRLLRQAASLYQGPFLDQFFLGDSSSFEEWAAINRENLNCQAIQALTLLADYHELRGEYTQARSFAARLVELMPWDENNHARLMHLLAMDGQWSAAQAQYASCRARLAEEMGLEPTRGTTALFENIRQAASRGERLAPRLPLAPQNLPPEQTPFIGRAGELDELAHRLADPTCRLLTLFGPGGSGKTRLALQAAREQVGTFSDGVFFVPLAEVRDMPQAVPKDNLSDQGNPLPGDYAASGVLAGAIAAALDLPISNDPQGQALRRLRQRSMLLVLDNFEHLLSQVDCLAAILQQAPGVTCLVTSRQRLDLAEECVYQTEGMACPPVEESDPARLVNYDAITLFQDCARRSGQTALKTRPDSALETCTSQEISALVHICRLVEGLPLGIELAAAALLTRTYQEVAAQLAKNIDILKRSTANLPPRLRSLRATIDYSWQLLTPQEQNLLKRLSVLHSEFSPAAAQALLPSESPINEDETRTLLGGLADKSLLRRSTAGYTHIHEALRQVAAEKLAADPQAERQAQTAHARYFAAFVAQRQADLKGERQQQAIDELACRHPDLRAAWREIIEQRLAEEAASCIDGLYHYDNIRSQFQEGAELLAAAARAFSADAQATRLAGMTWSRAGALYLRRRDYTLSRQALQAARAIFEQINEEAVPISDGSNLSELAFCLVSLGGLAHYQQEIDQALALARQALALYEQAGDVWGQSYAFYLSGWMQNLHGDNTQAKASLQASLRLSRITGDRRRLIAPLNILGDIACSEGDYKTAQELFSESLALSRTFGDRYNTAILLGNLASVFYAQGDFSAARQLYTQSLHASQEIDDTVGEALSLNNLGEVALVQGGLLEAEHYARQALRLARQIEDPWTITICLNTLGEVLVKQAMLVSTAPQDASLAEASASLSEALRLAHESRQPDIQLKTLVNLAALFAACNERTRAAQLLWLAVTHPACDQEIVDKARLRLAELGSPPQPEGLHSLEAIMDELVNS